MTNSVGGEAGLAVERVFMVLDRFAHVKSPLTLTEIASGLDLPKSSVLKLLRGMKDLGYLTEDRSTKTYFPSRKISNLGRDVEKLLIGHHETIVMLEDLRNATGESVSIAVQNAVEVAFFNSLLGKKQLTLNLDDGASYPIHVSAAGRAILASFDDDAIKKLGKKIMSEERPGWPKFDTVELSDNLDQIRTCGYATTHPDASTDVISIAKLLPHKLGLRPVAISVGGARQNMLEKEAEIVAIINKLFTRYYSD